MNARETLTELEIAAFHFARAGDILRRVARDAAGPTDDLTALVAGADKALRDIQAAAAAGRRRARAFRGAVRCRVR